MHSIAGAIVIFTAVYAHYQERPVLGGESVVPMLLLIVGLALFVWDFRAVIPWKALRKALVPWDPYRKPPI